MSQTGLTYATDPFDRRRYEEMREIAAEMMAAETGAESGAVAAHYRLEDGYATPKIDVRGVCVRDDAVLLVRERSDGLWTLPGGWADVGDTPSRSVEREVWEESGYTARAVRLLALLDRDRQGHPPIPYHAYKAFFLCEITGGSPATDHETDAAGFFRPASLPPLSTERVTEAQIRRCFDLSRHPEWPPDFD